MACIRKRRERYVIDFYDNKGRRRWKTLPKGTTLKKAKEKLRDIEDKLAKDIYIPDRDVPKFSEVAQDWLKQKKQNIRASTLTMYRGHLKKHFEKVNDIPINRITIARVENWIAEKRDANMNITTLRKLIITFNQVMQFSIRHRYVDSNPVRDAERPRAQGSIQDDKPKIQVLKPTEINDFLKSVDDQMYKVLFKLAIASGARQGELLGLKWKDVKFENSQIKIRRTYNNMQWYRPKSEYSIRDIDIGPEMMADLKKWKLACPPNVLDLVFPSEAGQPLNHSVLLRKHFWPALKAAKLPKFRFHDLRHTYATYKLKETRDIIYTSRQLGHSKPTTTLDVYGHVLADYDKGSARRLEKMLFSQTGSRRDINGGQMMCKLLNLKCPRQGSNLRHMD